MLLSDYGLSVGGLPRGRLNKITDVAGVSVGHCTVDDGEKFHTGVTVVMPAPEFIYLRKLPAATFVQNGFGKSVGMMQIDELGTLETPIALTSTLNVGLVSDALVAYTAERLEAVGGRLATVNPAVFECNDAENSQALERPVKLCHVFNAIKNASRDFDEGSVGAGRGTICHRLKGGIGSASRIVTLQNGDNRSKTAYTLGALVQTNQGELDDLTVCEKHIGPEIRRRIEAPQAPDVGSVIVVIATDAPLSDRQLKRVLKRSSVGIINVGSHLGHASGDVYVGFSTANALCPSCPPVRAAEAFNENYIDCFFRAAAEAVEEAVLNSMLAAEPLLGYTGTLFHSLTEFDDLLR